MHASAETRRRQQHRCSGGQACEHAKNKAREAKKREAAESASATKRVLARGGHGQRMAAAARTLDDSPKKKAPKPKASARKIKGGAYVAPAKKRKTKR